MNANRIIVEPFGPVYPALGASVAKFRKIAAPTAAQRAAHGDAVGEAIRALQRAELMRADAQVVRPRCASGTWHNNGDGAVGAAIRDQQSRALAACPGAIRRARTPREWSDLYKAAMREKQAAAVLDYPLIAAE